MAYDPMAGDVVDSMADEGWWSDGLKKALPQILKVTGRKGTGGSPTANANAKPVNANAASAMKVPEMIGKAAGNNPLDDLNKWSNTF